MAASSGLGVESYAELYSTILGWHQYNILWTLLTETGLVFLPFLGMLIRHVLESLQSQTGVDASITTLKRLEIDFIQMLLVILLVGQPIVTLKVEELKFIKLCTKGFQGGEKVIAADDPTERSLYRQSAMIDSIRSAKVPAWWYAVMSVSSGITHAAKKSLPCLPYSKDVLHGAAAVLSDKAIINELKLFIKECHGPVQNFLTKESRKFKPEEWQESKFNSLVEKHGVGKTFKEKLESIDWPGSPVYLEMPGRFFYSEIIPPHMQSTIGARAVTCTGWWTDYFRVAPPILRLVPGIGTRLESTFNNLLLSQSEYTKQNKDQIMAHIIREVLRRELVLTDQLFPSLNAVTERTWGDKFSEVMAGIGIKWSSLATYPVSHAIQTASPIVLSLLLMALYIMLPLGLVISSYSLEYVIAASVGMFTIKFLSYFFLVAYWMDQNLLLITGGGGSELSFLASSTFNFVVNSTLFAFPILFMMVMSWTGINIGSVILNAFDKLGGRASAVGTGARWIGHQMQQIIKMLARIARKMIFKI